jgi:hypothetical protein
MQMMAYQNYIHKFMGLLLIYAAEKQYKWKRCWGFMLQELTVTCSRLTNTTCGKQPLYHGMPEIISIHYIYIYILKNVKRMEEN